MACMVHAYTLLYIANNTFTLLLGRLVHRLVKLYIIYYVKCKCKGGMTGYKDGHLQCWMKFHSFHTRTVTAENMSQTHLVQLYTFPV